MYLSVSRNPGHWNRELNILKKLIARHPVGNVCWQFLVSRLSTQSGVLKPQWLPRRCGGDSHWNSTTNGSLPVSFLSVS